MGQPYGPPAFDVPRRPVFRLFFGFWETLLTDPDPDRLAELGKRLDRLQTGRVAGPGAHPPGRSGIAFRFTTEMVAALIVGGGLGWGIDWLFGHFGIHTRPAFLIVFFVLGAGAGIRNVVCAANELNAEIARQSRRPDKEK